MSEPTPEFLDAYKKANEQWPCAHQAENVTVGDFPSCNMVLSTLLIDKLKKENAHLESEIGELRQDLADFKELHKMICDRVLPGTTDSVDAVRQIVKQVQVLRVALEPFAVLPISATDTPQVISWIEKAKQALAQVKEHK